jgi:SSS family solute:Na+ symporter
MGIHWTGLVFGLGIVISFGYWTTDFLVVQRVLSAHNLRAARMAPIIGAGFKMMVPFIVILPGLLALSGAALSPGSAKTLAAATGQHSYNEVLPLMLVRYCGPGSAGAGSDGADCGLHVGHGGQRERVRDGVDLRHLRRVYQ